VLSRLAISSAIALFLSASAQWLTHSSVYGVTPVLEADITADEPAFGRQLRVPGNWRSESDVLPYASPRPEVTEAPPPPDLIKRQVVSLSRGETLMDLLSDASVSRETAQDAIAALKSVFDPRRLRTGQEFELLFDTVNGDRLVGIQFQPAVEREVAINLDGGEFQVTETRKKTERQLVAARGRIDSSLFEAATSAGVPLPVLSAMIAQYSYDVDFARDIQPGDSFEILYERDITEEGEVARDGEIRFARMILSGKPLPIYRYENTGGPAEYFNRAGSSIRKALLRTPVDGARVSSGFGMRRHPVLGYTTVHKGKDFAAPVGTKIYAAGEGVIEEIGPKGSFGNYIAIRHAGQIRTAYAHLSRFAGGLHRGTRVIQGTIIGYVGSTGRSTGPHLHFEVRVGSRQVNPDGKEARFESGRRLDGPELRAFQALVANVEAHYAEATASGPVAAAEPQDRPRVIPASLKSETR
jgi:murein DD-endopeptidase MepM/ murein hydrolase activator NlpD